MLRLVDVSRTFRQGEETLEVLRNINLSVESGEIVAMLGFSGSGKTTLLQIAGLLEKPTRGEVIIGGVNASKLSDSERTALRRTHIGFIYQFHHLMPEFSAVENIMIPLLVSGKGKDQAREESMNLLRELGMEARAHHRPARLSGGEQQRVAILRAIAPHPKLILADEPTGNLDPRNAGHVFEILCTLAQSKGIAALIATHNMEMAGRMDRVFNLSEIIAHGDGGLSSEALAQDEAAMRKLKEAQP